MGPLLGPLAWPATAARFAGHRTNSVLVVGSLVTIETDLQQRKYECGERKHHARVVAIQKLAQLQMVDEHAHWDQVANVDIAVEAFDALVAR